MGDADLLNLIVRTVVSLSVVLAVIGVAFAIARRRAATGSVGRSSRRRAPAPAIEVVGRAGLARSASAVALRFGDRVVMVGVSDQAPTAVLAEIDAATWDDLHPAEETLVPTPVPFGANGTAVADPGAPRPSFFDALRDATTRRA